MTQRCLAPLAFAALLAISATARAQAVDLTTVSTHGDVTTTGASALLTTAALDSGETPLGATSALLFTDLEFVLLPGGGTLGADAFEGSALSHTFTLATPGTVSFHWTLSTVETDPAFLDRAFVSFDESVSTLATATFAAQSGVHVSALLGAGTHRFAVGVVDLNDVTGVSTLQVSNLAIQTTAVPEPGTFATLIAGLGLVGARLRRRAG